MQIVIDINDVIYKEIMNRKDVWSNYVHGLIRTGEPLPKGHWIIHPKDIYAHLKCNQCLTSAPYDIRINFCPNCGARMTESEDKS